METVPAGVKVKVEKLAVVVPEEVKKMPCPAAAPLPDRDETRGLRMVTLS